ncbi:hypothetical protein E1263_31760 [Kribbella antibiotica]|uniref:Uncharacterized protein n=1 Tax=Kribbella antibiotica TaxID=190195 RepID=A0A4R4YWG3_9ACTN|nr:hypothetical protein [Kribbella antibiotica]TDD49781.1 hypothetical protein E1263_31760 [Kribbella antibiotica]
MTGEREEFLAGLQAEVEQELTVLDSAAPDTELPVEQWTIDPAEEAMEKASLQSLLGAVKALEE